MTADQQLLENLRFLRRTSKFKFAKDQFLMVGEVMHQAADEIELLRKQLDGALETIRNLQPSETATPFLRCRFDCPEPAVVLVEFQEGGCVCWPDRIQALCAQHWHKAEPIQGARVITRLSVETCGECGGTGRRTIYDKATYPGQLCSPIGDEPCPTCSPEKTPAGRPMTKGELEVGLSRDERMVILNHPQIDQDERGGHILFSPAEARHLGELLIRKANECTSDPRSPDPVYCKTCGQEDRDCYCDPSRYSSPTSAMPGCPCPCHRTGEACDECCDRPAIPRNEQ